MNAGERCGLDIGVLAKRADIDWACDAQIRQYIWFINHYFLITMIYAWLAAGRNDSIKQKFTADELKI
jgi:hypothetical protein